MARPALEGLSPVELVVLEGAAAGESTAETAARVHRSFETVKRHRKHILWKLRGPDGSPSRNMTHAVARAYDRGTLTPRHDHARGR